MRIKPIYILIIISAVTFSSCGIWNKYTPVKDVRNDLYGTTEGVNIDTTRNMADLSWREFFTDPLLQELIDSVLARNNDMTQVRLSVEQMDAALKAAKLAYIPSFSFAPSATIGYNTGIGSSTFTWNVPIDAQWQLDIFGGITNAKRRTEAQTWQARDMLQATQSQLIARTAAAYYQLVMLDHQMETARQTVQIREESVETQKALMKAGFSFSTGVQQMEASLVNAQIQILDIQDQIVAAELALAKLTADVPKHINRSSYSALEKQLADVGQNLSVGLPIQLLENRPDVRAAQREWEAAFYQTQGARSQMYPNITLSGLAGFVNGDGASLNPADLALSLAGSLLQPIFQGGKLRANLKISKAQQEAAANNFQQRLLDAGAEVNQRLAHYSVTQERVNLYKQEVEFLTSAYNDSRELMSNGQINYLEVLTAQESLFIAKLNEVSNVYDELSTLIGLYMSLGGGAK